jgi:hypothetical protein
METPRLAHGLLQPPPRRHTGPQLRRHVRRGGARPLCLGGRGLCTALLRARPPPLSAGSCHSHLPRCLRLRRLRLGLLPCLLLRVLPASVASQYFLTRTDVT